jgi:hypothetical protein
MTGAQPESVSNRGTGHATPLPGHVDVEPTQPLGRPLPDHGDPIWSLGHETARLVVDFVLDELPGEVAAR